MRKPAETVTSAAIERMVKMQDDWKVELAEAEERVRHLRVKIEIVDDVINEMKSVG